ncbi:MAG TPA: Nudix family hydrolase [Burkholderiales bacterium]|nr:Nudix family hydrolase [Burkholderiales bacterium]
MKAEGGSKSSNPGVGDSPDPSSFVLHPSKVVEVAVAIIERDDGSFLLAQRPHGKAYAGYWEFPGGKVEAGEPVAMALRRELHEELGIEVVQAYPWITRVYSYPHASVRLHFHRVLKWAGEPRPHEEQALSWQRCGALSVAPMLPANAPVLKALSLPIVYAITHAWETGVERALAHLDDALAKGLRLVQIREGKLERPAREAFAAKVTQRTHAFGGIVLVNGDEHLARQIGADGLHLPAHALMAARQRPQFEWSAASCHDAFELAHAADLGVDFAVLGPVLEKSGQPNLPGMGLQRFGNLAGGHALPVFALGGVRMSDLDNARAHGAHGVAMIRGAWQAGTRLS